MIIAFSINGNHKDPAGNPVPKLRMTGRQSWRPEAQSYAEWKQYVQECLQPHLLAAAIDMPPVPAEKLIRGGRYLKPITLSSECRMDLMIWWGSEHHADPESIFGSVADAIFVDDKHLKGSFDFAHSPEKKGRVDVKITI